MPTRQTAIVLFSGGIDSTVCLALAQVLGYDVHTMSFAYGQKHRHEILCQADILNYYDELRQRQEEIDCDRTGKIIQSNTIALDTGFMSQLNSSLTNQNMFVPTGRAIEEMGKEIPNTYVPGRNTMFLAHAFALAESIDATRIFIGANAMDRTGYPDCREEYFIAWNHLMDVAKGKPFDRLRIVVPLIDLSKSDIIRKGKALKAPLHLTSSCYKANDESQGKACGVCDSCLIRKKGFEEAGVEDPTVYV